MKLYKKLFLTFLFSQSILNAQISKAEIIATGLTCSMCSNAINKQLKSIADVQDVAIDLNSNTFVVYFKKNSTIEPKVLKDKVENAGFFVGSMIITLPFENANIAANTLFQNQNLNLIFVEKPIQILNGQTSIKIIDEGFVTKKEFKKWKKTYFKNDIFGLQNPTNYHVIVI